MKTMLESLQKEDMKLPNLKMEEASTKLTDLNNKISKLVEIINLQKPIPPKRKIVHRAVHQTPGELDKKSDNILLEEIYKIDCDPLASMQEGIEKELQVSELSISLNPKEI